MDSLSNEKSSIKQTNLLSNHNVIDSKFYSNTHLRSKFKIDDCEKKLLKFISDKEKFKIKIYEEDQFLVFLNSKLVAMEKIDLDDECLDGEIKTKKINIDKKEFPKQKHSKSEKKIYFPKREANKKNVIINRNGKVEKSEIECFNLDDDIKYVVDREIKKKELSKFFSDKTLLNSIINEMKDK